jgi:hypothetical protein
MFSARIKLLGLSPESMLQLCWWGESRHGFAVNLDMNERLFIIVNEPDFSTHAIDQHVGEHAV